MMAQMWCMVVMLVPSICLPALVTADSCTPGDTDVIDLAELGILQTSTISVDEINEEVVEKQVRGADIPVDYRTYFSTADRFQTMVEAGNVSVEFGEILKSTDDENESLANKAFLYYKPMCPYRYYWLSKYKWFFIQAGDIMKFCWPFNNIYVVSCQTRYCNNGFPWQLNMWPLRSRCVPIYRFVWIYSRCATLQNGQVTWSSEFIRRILPRGCECRSYKFPFTADKTCPVTIQKG